MKNNFYCYGHFDSQGVCRYVGKGKNRRAWSLTQRSKRWEKHFSEEKPQIVFFAENLTEEQALKCETEKIKELLAAGVDLINVFSKSDDVIISDKRSFEILSADRSGPNHYAYGKSRPRWIIERLHEGKRLKAPKPRLGAKLTEDHKKKLRDSRNTPEAIAKRSASMRGRKLSAEHRAKLCEARKNRVFTEETKKKISESNKGKHSHLKGTVMPQAWRDAISKATMGRRPLTAEEQARRMATWKARGMTSKKAKAVICKETGVTYRCAKEAAEQTGSSDKHIQACCTGRRKKHNGYTWAYVQ